MKHPYTLTCACARCASEGARRDAASVPGSAAWADRIRRDRAGVLTPADVDTLAAHPEGRLTLVLVRCGGCRFLAPAQDVVTLVAIIDRDGTEYVRDLSLPDLPLRVRS